MFYARHGRGKSFGPLIEGMIAELKEETGIDMVNVHVDVESELLWQRISQRLRCLPPNHLRHTHANACARAGDWAGHVVDRSPLCRQVRAGEGAL